MCAKICLSADLLMTMSGQDLSDFPHGTSERVLGSYSCNRAGKKMFTTIDLHHYVSNEEKRTPKACCFIKITGRKSLDEKFRMHFIKSLCFIFRDAKVFFFSPSEHTYDVLYKKVLTLTIQERK